MKFNIGDTVKVIKHINLFTGTQINHENIGKVGKIISYNEEYQMYEVLIPDEFFGKPTTGWYEHELELI